MRAPGRFAFLAALLIALPAALGAEGVRLEPVAAGQVPGRLLGIVEPDDGSGRLFLVFQTGEISILENGAVAAEPFLDVSSKVVCCENERGLLGLAFHPDYAANGLFYVSYVAVENDDAVVSRFSVSADPRRADAGSELELFRAEEPEPNHNIGQLAFGPDGYLYIGAGDGGAARNAQDRLSPLGKILRIDVDRGATYRVPADNPFVGDPDGLDEIWAWGLRNPWRFSFDRKTGDLFIGDVGGSAFEEIDFEAAGTPGGRNYGWPAMEAGECRGTDEECADPSLVPPILAYPHEHGHGEEDEGCNSVTGGFRYRGPKVPTMPRFYVFGDFCTGEIWGGRRNLSGNWVRNELAHSELFISTFGEDRSGGLYVGDYRGGLYRLVGETLFATDFESGGTKGWSRERGGLAVVESGRSRLGRALEVPVGGAARRFLASDHPTKETTLRIDWTLHPNGVDPGAAEIEILRLAGRKSGRGHTRLALFREGGRYRLAVDARDGGGGFRRLGSTRLSASRATRLALEWLQESAPGRGDGEVVLRKNGKIAVRASDLASGGRTVGSVKLGLPGGSAGATGGSFLVGDYASTP